MKRCCEILLATGLVLWGLGVPCPAEEEESPIVNLTLYPAAEPRPALKYQFTVPLHERRPGNAAVLYNKIPAERTRLFGRGYEFWEKLGKLSEAPLAELREKEAQKMLGEVQDVVRDLDTAALYESCDWQQPIHYGLFWEIPLPEVQQTRSFARCLAPYVRWQIAERRYENAVRSLRSGYVLARNIGRGPTIINSLVGAAIAGMMNRQVEALIQQPDSPNLYWALQALSRPVIDFRPGFEAEMDMVYLSFPDLCDLDNKKYPPDQWQALLNRTIEQLSPLVGRNRALGQVEMTTAILDGYPRAKQYLIERGRSAAEVEAMPVAQVVLLYTTAIYEEIRDDLFKWYQVSYQDAREGMRRADESLKAFAADRREIVPIAGTLLPAVGTAKMAETRIDRDYAALIVIEAIRLYAALHNGQLPETLADITEVPVPTDPFTGQPFQYRRDGKTVMLESITPRAGKSVRYHIQMLAKGRTP